MNSSTAGHARPRLALVLGAGGIKGWAHVGALKVLDAAGLPVDLIVGASAGALIGPLYAARRDAAETERIAMGFTPSDFVQWFLNDLRLSPGAGRMGRCLWNAYGRLDFGELDVPFAALALDLGDRGPAVLTAGNVGRAVEASIRPPLITRPVWQGGRVLVDGGLHSTVPVAVARELGAELVVAVDVGELIALPPSMRSLSGRVGSALDSARAGPAGVRSQLGFLAGLVSRGRPPRQRADVEIRPDLRGVNPVWPWHIHRAARRGEAAARRALPAIRRLLAARAA
ncbi:MAG: patatin-like phospholipase family protein [Dehalococcoidia bacterium]|nr:patatin-like phospholipase family protein [Dehalococcoidia bacterium]